MSTDSFPPIQLRLLHLEDSVADAELIKHVLNAHWPDCHVDRVQTRDDFVAALEREQYGLILSDYSMPGFNGLAALDIAREMKPDIPYIFLSGTIGEENAVEALRKGATDYVIKDRMARLVPAVQRALDEAGLVRRRNRVEQKLKENQERFQQLADQSSEVFWFVGLNPEKITFVGPAIERIWGQPPECFYNDPRAWTNAIHPEERDRVRKAYDDCVSGRSAHYDQEYRVIRPDGTICWVADSGTLIHDAEGEAVRISGIAKDITERKAGEQRLREQAELLDKARDAIVVTNLDRQIIYWNHGAERMLGWTAAEALGKTGADLFGLQALSEIYSRRNFSNGDEWQGEIVLCDKSGRRRIVESRMTVIRDATGAPKSHLTISTDITERKEMGQQLLRAQRLESIGMLAGGIAHDLNNVLAPILMAVHLLQQTVSEASARRMLGVLETSAHHGAGLVRQVLAFARGGEGERDDLQPHLVIRDVLALLGETLPRSITIESDVPANLDLVHSNSTQLGQVLMNLCVNARDAMLNGGTLKISARNVTVDDALARAHPGAKAGPHVLLTVKDTGTGIPPQVIDRIFDPFFTTKAVGKGTGLGLSTVAGIVRGDGGFLDVKSEVGAGTEFFLYFPAVFAPRKTHGVVPGDLPGSGQGETILVIDDEESIRVVAEALLNAAGYRVVLARNGVEGIATYRLHSDKIGAVLTDIMMPGMSAVKLVGELRRINPDVAIVAMSGIMGETSGLTEEPGRLKFLQKPMTGMDIVGALQSVLTRT